MERRCGPQRRRESRSMSLACLMLLHWRIIFLLFFLLFLVIFVHRILSVSAISFRLEIT